jgi:hypothetical protein
MDNALGNSSAARSVLGAFARSVGQRVVRGVRACGGGARPYDATLLRGGA